MFTYTVCALTGACLDYSLKVLKISTAAFAVSRAEAIDGKVIYLCRIVCVSIVSTISPFLLIWGLLSNNPIFCSRSPLGRASIDRNANSQD